jgi:hypothetical protein
METHRDGKAGGPRFADPQTIQRVIGHPTYQLACSEYRSFLTRSRAVRDEPQKLLELQGDLAERLLGLEAAQRRQKSIAKDKDLGPAELEEVTLRLAVARRLAHVIREIADGIAWRFFYYDRAGLYQLARKPQVGHLDEASINNEMANAEAHAATGALVLLNDLTNFVKFGDITRRTDDGFKFIEVKGGKGSAGSGHTTKQLQKLKEMADFINAGSRQIPTGTERLHRLRTVPRTHLATVEALINEARRTGTANARLSESLAVVVRYLAHPAMGSLRRLPDDNPFSQSRKWLAGNSLSGFDYFTPNRAPYTVFPWSDADCADLLAGTIWIVSYLSWGKSSAFLRSVV